MRLSRGYVFFCLAAVLCSSVPATAQFTANCSVECYGPGLGSDGLANTTVGPNGNRVSYRLRARHSGSLQQIHVYLIPDKTGYAAGTGGNIQITINTDDGTAAHGPSSTVLATYLLTDANNASPSRYFPIFTFANPPSLFAGELYHVVFVNVDASPSVNYLSVDALYLQSPGTPAQPTVSDTDAAELLGRPGAAWAPRKGYLPILQLDFTDGWTEGTGYMESWIGAPQVISGSSAVRERFTVSGNQRKVGKVAVRLARVSGSDPLTVRLQNADGSLIEEGSISASALPNPPTHNWTQYQFTSARTLAAGQTYYLELSTASSSVYQIFPIRKGVGYNFKNTTWWPDGYAQFKQGDTWVGWTQWGVANRSDGDLQFYFENVATSGDSGSGSSSVSDVEGYTFCANEGGDCVFSGTKSVSYGAGQKFVYRTITGGTPCTNAVFGDPNYGAAKACYTQDSATGAGTSSPAPSSPPSSAPAAASAAGYTFCANEGGDCVFSGTKSVSYGAGQKFVYRTITGGTPCTNAVFGDPNYGAAKACYTQDSAAGAAVPSSAPSGSSAASYTFCAREGGECTFSGTKSVAYGAGTNMVSLTLSNGTACTNAVFGDPIYGVSKACYISDTATTGP